jgi:glycosyltransferase involved in cell wall biosynthesis
LKINSTSKSKLIRITTVPQSLKLLLKGQLHYMSSRYEVIAIASEKAHKKEVCLKEVEHQEQVRTIAVNMSRQIDVFRDIISLVTLFFLLKKEKPTIVHTHTPKAGLLGMLAAKFAGVPVRLHTVAGLPLVETRGIKRRLLEFIEKITYSCAHKVYPNSRGQSEFILEHKFTNSTKLKVLGNGSSNGIDTSFFDPELFTDDQVNNLKEKYKIPKDDFLFIFIGRLVRDKGVNELIKSFTALSEKHLNTSLLLVGKYEEHLNPLDKETHYQIFNHKKIIHVGYQNDVRIFFHMSDCLVFPSYREGFPNVPMQGGAMGLPAIVSDINGCNEIVTHQQNGLIVPVKNYKAIFDAMERFYLDTDLLESCTLNARKNIVEKYDRNLLWKLLHKEYMFFEEHLKNV